MPHTKPKSKNHPGNCKTNRLRKKRNDNRIDTTCFLTTIYATAPAGPKAETTTFTTLVAAAYNDLRDGNFDDFFLSWRSDVRLVDLLLVLAEDLQGLVDLGRQSLGRLEQVEEFSVVHLEKHACVSGHGKTTSRVFQKRDPCDIPSA